MKFLLESSLLDLIKTIGSSKGNIDQKIQFLIKARRDNQDNEIQKAINTELDKLYNMKYSDRKKVVGESKNG